MNVTRFFTRNMPLPKNCTIGPAYTPEVGLYAQLENGKYYYISTMSLTKMFDFIGPDAGKSAECKHDKIHNTTIPERLFCVECGKAIKEPK